MYGAAYGVSIGPSTGAPELGRHTMWKNDTMAVYTADRAPHLAPFDYFGAGRTVSVRIVK